MRIIIDNSRRFIKRFYSKSGFSAHSADVRTHNHLNDVVNSLTPNELLLKLPENTTFK